jgi:hypothetical protein
VGEARSGMTATRWAVGMRERKLLVGLDILFGGRGFSDVDGRECLVRVPGSSRCIDRKALGRPLCRRCFVL